MSEYELFNLEKIQELTKPIEKFEGKVRDLEINFERFSVDINQYLNETRDTLLKEEIKQIFLEFNNVYTHLIKKSNSNLLNFLYFQENLTKDQLNLFEQNLKEFDLDINELGLNLIETRKIRRIHDRFSLILSPSSDLWAEMLESLEINSLFLRFFEKSKDILGTYKIKPAEEIFIQNGQEQTVEIEPESKMTKYDEYLKYSDEEFQKRRRRERRADLAELQEKPDIPIDMTKEIAEKIADYKSKMKSDFDERYLIQKDKEKDPISIIQDLRKKKEEEYKAYFKRIKNKKTGENTDTEEN